MPSAHLVQLDCRWEDRSASRSRAHELLGRHATAPGDLIVLPEMFETGFSMRVERTADDDGSSARWLAQLAKDRAATVIGGITVRRSDGVGLNRALAFDPRGDLVAQYDKIHPFSYGREARHFVGGAEVVAYDWVAEADSPPVRIGLAICYDLRFPELFRALRARGAEVLVVIANWPAVRHEHWRALLRARAIENQAVVLGVNRAGSDPFLEYAGGSAALDAKGATIVETPRAEGVFTAPLEEAISAARAWREEFPAWADAKPWLLGGLAGGAGADGG